MESLRCIQVQIKNNKKKKKTEIKNKKLRHQVFKGIEKKSSNEKTSDKARNWGLQLGDWKASLDELYNIRSDHNGFIVKS